MKKFDINQLEQINGGSCGSVAALASAGAVVAACTLNPVLMGACALLSVLNAYTNC